MRKYKIYKIECDINLETDEQLNNFLPIYIGCTCQELSQRFKCHKAGKRTLYPYIQKYGIIHFRISEITSIYANKLEAHKLEERITIEYAKRYTLLNKIYGDKKMENSRLHLSIKNSPYKVEINGKIYQSALLASKDLNIPKQALIDLINGRTKESYQYIVDSISYEDKPIYHLMYLEKSQINERISRMKEMKIIFTIDNLQFFSIRELAEYLHCTKSAVNNFINNRSKSLFNMKTITIIQHEDCKEYILSHIPKNYVFHMDKKDVYESEFLAERAIDNRAKNGGHVKNCCLGKISSVLNNHFRYLTEEEIKLYLENENNRFNFDCSLLYKFLQQQYIFHIESNQIFESAKLAAQYIHSQTKDGGHVGRCARGKEKSFYGNHFRIPTIEEIKEYLRKKSE